MKILKDKNICDISGFQAIGISCGIKKGQKKDLSILYSQYPAVAAATFTTNKVKAAPVLVSMEHIQSESTRAVVINSGNANACTGQKGIEDAVAMTVKTAKCLGLNPEEVLVASTGIIGVPLPMDRIEKGIQTACSSLSSGGEDGAAEAIMTTDTFPKKITVETTIGNKPVQISGIAKGSGMIHPNMATMLAFIVTDANITKTMLTKALRDSIQNSYNMVSVDGDTSTNDTVIALANGAAENPLIKDDEEDYDAFKNAFDFVNQELAKMIAKDGEGATKLIEVSVSHANSETDAKICAKAVISSSLVKAAFFGSDANWGRILCAMGYSGANFDPEKIDISFQSRAGTIQLVEKGMGIPFSEEKALKILKEDHIIVLIDLKDGKYHASAWGCDLSYEYVKINGCYRT